MITSKVKVIATWLLLAVGFVGAYAVTPTPGDIGKMDKACNGGASLVCYTLGYWYDNGKTIRLDRKQAGKYYQLACSGKVAMGCYNLGSFYSNGQGVSVDYVRAKQLYSKACDLHLPKGCVAYMKLKKLIG